MKKLVCLILSLVFLFSLCACSDSEPANTDNVNSKVVSTDTIELVDNALKKTTELISSAKSLGYYCDFKRTDIVDEQRVAQSLTTDIVIHKGEGGDKLSFETETKTLAGEDGAIVYNADGKTYAYKAGNCYLLADDDTLKAYVKQLYATPATFKSENIKALDTTVVNTSTGGKGFVVEYDAKDEDFKPVDVFAMLYAEAGMKDVKPTPVSLRLSGIVDKDGKILTHTVKYVYEYEITVTEEVDDSQVDVESETVTVTKKVTVELEAEVSYDFTISEVKVPEGITVPVKDAEGNETPKLKELSLVDFQKLSLKTGEAD